MMKSKHAPKSAIEVDEITLPAYYATAFINGDFSGIEDDAECEHVQKIVDDLAAKGWSIVSTKDDSEPRFTNCFHLHHGYQPEGHPCLVTGGDVLDYVILRQTREG